MSPRLKLKNSKRKTAIAKKRHVAPPKLKFALIVSDATDKYGRRLEGDLKDEGATGYPMSLTTWNKVDKEFCEALIFLIGQEDENTVRDMEAAASAEIDRVPSKLLFWVQLGSLNKHTTPLKNRATLLKEDVWKWSVWIDCDAEFNRGEWYQIAKKITGTKHRCLESLALPTPRSLPTMKA